MNPLEQSRQQLAAILKSVRDGTMVGKNDDELRAMIVHVRTYQNSFILPGGPEAIQAIENELSRRQIDRHTEIVKAQHRQTIEESGKIHSSIQDYSRTSEAALDINA